MKKLMILILALSILLCACGQGGNTPSTPPTDPTAEPTAPVTQPTDPPAEPELSTPFCGRWSYSVTVDGSMMALPDFTGKVTYPLVWSFRPNGSVTVMEDRDAYLEAIARFEGMVIDFMVESRYDLFVSECHYNGHYSAYIEKEWVTNGLGEQVRQEMTESVSALQLSVRCAPARFLGEYKAEEDLLTVTDSEGVSYRFTFTQTEDCLTLTPLEGTELLEALDLPSPLSLTAVGRRPNISVS